MIPGAGGLALTEHFPRGTSRRALHLYVRGLAGVLTNPDVRSWLENDDLNAHIDVDGAIHLDTSRKLGLEAWRLVIVLGSPPGTIGGGRSVG